MKIYCFCIVLVLFNTAIYAQTITTDRPDQSESSSLIPKNSLQIESGVILQNTADSNNNLLPTILIRYGLSSSFELRLITNFVNLEDKVTSITHTGFSDIEVGTKFQIKKKEASTTEIAFLTHLSIPTAKKEISNENLGIINKFIVSHAIGTHSGIGYNIGYNYFGIDSGDVTYTLSFSTNITDRILVYAEPYGLFSNFEKHTANFDAGIAYLLKDNIQVDVSYGLGLNNSLRFIAFGFSWNLKDL